MRCPQRSVSVSWWIGWPCQTRALFGAHFGVSSSSAASLVIGGGESRFSIIRFSSTSRLVVQCGGESEMSITGLRVVELGIMELLVLVGEVEVASGSGAIVP